MLIACSKPAKESKTFCSAGRAKKLNIAITVVSSLVGVQFLGAPLLEQFFPTEWVSEIEAIALVGTTVMGALGAQQSKRAQVGRLDAIGLVYTPTGQPGHDQGVGPVLLPSSIEELQRLNLVMPYLEGYDSIEAVYGQVKAADRVKKNYDRT